MTESLKNETQRIELFSTELNNDYMADADEMVSQHPPITIVDRKIEMPKDYTITVAQDNVSQLLMFTWSRFYNGIDLHRMACSFVYINANKEDAESVAVSRELIGETTVRFGWLLSDHVAAAAGQVKFLIKFTGITKSGQTYMLKTLPAVFDVAAGLVVSSDEAIAQKYPTIIETIRMDLRRLELRIDDIANAGLVPFASEEDALNGVFTNLSMSPYTTKLVFDQAIEEVKKILAESSGADNGKIAEAISIADRINGAVV